MAKGTKTQNTGIDFNTFAQDVTVVGGNRTNIPYEVNFKRETQKDFIESIAAYNKYKKGEKVDADKDFMKTFSLDIYNGGTYRDSNGVEQPAVTTVKMPLNIAKLTPDFDTAVSTMCGKTVYDKSRDYQGVKTDETGKLVNDPENVKSPITAELVRADLKHPDPLKDQYRITASLAEIAKNAHIDKLASYEAKEQKDLYNKEMNKVGGSDRVTFYADYTNTADKVGGVSAKSMADNIGIIAAQRAVLNSSGATLAKGKALPLPSVNDVKALGELYAKTFDQVMQDVINGNAKDNLMSIARGDKESTPIPNTAVKLGKDEKIIPTKTASGTSYALQMSPERMTEVMAAVTQRANSLKSQAINDPAKGFPNTGDAYKVANKLNFRAYAVELKDNAGVSVADAKGNPIMVVQPSFRAVSEPYASNVFHANKALTDRTDDKAPMETVIEHFAPRNKDTKQPDIAAGRAYVDQIKSFRQQFEAPAMTQEVSKQIKNEAVKAIEKSVNAELEAGLSK